MGQGRSSEEVAVIGWESERGGVSYCESLGKSLPGRGKRKCKGPEVGTHDRLGTGAMYLKQNEQWGSLR